MVDDFAPPEVPAALQPVVEVPPVATEVTPAPPVPVAEVVPAPPVAPTTSPDGQGQPVKVVRVIDLKDGSGVQRFEAEGPTLAEAQDALLDKITTAQENATRKIRELREKAKTKPNRNIVPSVKFSPRQPTDAELVAIKELWTTNPVEAFRQIQELATGIKPQALIDAVETAQSQHTKLQLDTAATEFIADHLEDFDNSAASGKLIYDFLRGCTREVKEGGFACTFCGKTHDPSLVPYRDNLEYAFEQLSDSGVKFMKAPEPVAVPPAPVVVVPPPVVPVPVVAAPPAPEPPRVVATTVPPPPVTVSDRSGQRTPAPDNSLEGVDVAKLVSGSLSDMRAGIQRLAKGR